MGQNRRESGTAFLDHFLREHLPQYKNLLDHPSHYRLQVIYTRIDRDKNNTPVLKPFYYRCDPQEFFSPASLVKLPVSMMVLEKLNGLKVAGLSMDSRFTEDSNYRCQNPVLTDKLAADSIPRLSGMIREALIVSDNEAYNRLYEFLGQQTIYRRLKGLGFPEARIVQRFALCDSVANKFTNAFTFFDGAGKMVFRQEPVMNPETYPAPLGKVIIGKGHINESNRMVHKGMNFTGKNYLPLADIDDILKRVIFPSIYPVQKRFRLNGSDLGFVRFNMAITPAESGIPAFQKKRDYWDTYTNYLFYGCEEDVLVMSDLRIFNIVGQSFGFLSDCAYFVDFTNKVEFFLSATLYVNQDEILNDGKYEYKTIGFPFLRDLGKAIYQYELTRAKANPPDLREFQLLFLK
jgi:hypothetical protein